MSDVKEETKLGTPCVEMEFRGTVMVIPIVETIDGTHYTRMDGVDTNLEIILDDPDNMGEDIVLRIRMKTQMELDDLEEFEGW